jgi:DNA-binding CsgD family transcriptional regulator
MTPEAFAKVVDELYAGTLDDAAWNRAMLEIADSVGASGAFLLSFDPRSGGLFRYENHRLDPQVLIDYEKHWTYEDIRREYFLNYPTCVPVTERMLPIGTRWRRSAILNDFLTPQDVPHFMPAWLHKAPNKVVALSFQGTRKRGPFEPKDLATYQNLAPHISRALAIRDRLESAKVRATTLARSLDEITFGMLVLDRGGVVLEANALAREALSRADGIRREQDGTLWLRDPAGRQLRRWIVSEVPPGHSHEGLLRVPRLNGLPLSVTVAPLPAQYASWLGRDDPRWLVLIFDPDRRVLASVELIERDLAISPREAQVAALLAAGYSLREAAQRLEVSVHTARAQLKSIFRKSGIHSQSELVRRVALGPAARPRA